MSTLRRIFVRSFLVSEETAGNAIKELMTNSVHDLGLTVDNCRSKSYDCAGNMPGRYTGALTLIQRQSSKFILLLDKFTLVETSRTNCWIHPWEDVTSCDNSLCHEVFYSLSYHVTTTCYATKRSVACDAVRHIRRTSWTYRQVDSCIADEHTSRHPMQL